MNTQTLFCQKLKKQAQALPAAPFPSLLGKRIFEQISKEAWQLWLAHQTMLINEYRLNLMDPQSRVFLNQEMEKFLFGEGSDKPSGYVPVKE